MKKTLFLLGLLSFFYVNSQVIRLIELPSLTSTLETFYSGSGSTKASFAPPANDECDGAIELTVNADYACEAVTSATLVGATDSGLETDLGTADDDVWFSFTATAETHKIALRNIEAEDWDGMDLVIEVFAESCNGTLVASSDPQSVTVTGLVPEMVYFVRVYSYYATVVDTTFDICIGTLPGVPVNDECSEAITLTVSPTLACDNAITGTVLSATDSGIATTVGTADDDVWYSFTALSTSQLISLTDLEGDVTDLVFQVFEGDCNGLTSLKISDPESAIVSDLVIDQIYYVRVFSYGSDNNADTLFNICIAIPPSAPANDECDAAVALTSSSTTACATPTSGTLQSATNSGLASTVGTADDDVWYSFTALSTSQLISLTDVEGNVTDLVFQVFEGDCNGLTSLKISDPDTAIVGDLIIDQTYYIRVFSYGSDNIADTVFDICVAIPPPAPANDECDAVVALTVSTATTCTTPTSGTLQSSTDSGLASSVGTADDDVWYSFTALSTSQIISLTDVEGDVTDLVFQVFEGDCSGLTSIKISDPESAIVNGLVIDQTYYVRVFSYGSENNPDTVFDICITTPPPAPANDECDAAVALTASATPTCATPTSGTVQSATDSGLATSVGTADDDVWYSFTAISTSQLISLTNVEGEETTDLVFQVFEGDCSGLNSIKISDPESAIVSDLVIDQIYYIRVFSYGSDNDADTVFDICVSTPGDAPANDECDAAVELTVNDGFTCEAFTSGTLTFATDSGIEAETGNADDDVWYSFTAISDTHKITAFNIEGNTTDLVMEVFDGDCAAEIIASSDPQTFTVTGLSEGTVYYVRVFSYGTLFASTTFDICVVSLPSVSPNDECEDAIALTVNTNGNCDVVTTATLANATDSGIEAETGNANDDIWFSFVATGTSHKVTVSDSDDFETIVIEVFEGVCGELSLISNPDSSYVNDLTIGQTYYVRAFSYDDDPVFSTFDICIVQRQDPPANDECAGAIALTVDAAFCNGVLTNAGNMGATASEEDEAECFNVAENDVWFTFTVPANVASVDISTDFTGGTLEDSVIALYSGACGDLTEIDCNDDGGEETLSVLTDIAVNVGETYYVRVTGYSADDEGTFCLEISTNETLSTGGFTKNTLKAYPNPVKDLLNLNNSTEITEVAIFNLLGQQVMVKTVNANVGQIDMSHLSAGAYLVKVTADNAVQTIKIIKE